jgi:hypothetical protein
MTYVALFVATFGYVMLRAFQQRNVAFDNYWWVPPVAFGMATFDAYLIATVAQAGLTVGVVIANGTAGTLGALTAMWFHKRFVKEHKS